MQTKVMLNLPGNVAVCSLFSAKSSLWKHQKVGRWKTRLASCQGRLLDWTKKTAVLFAAMWRLNMAPAPQMSQNPGESRALPSQQTLGQRNLPSLQQGVSAWV